MKINNNLPRQFLHLADSGRADDVLGRGREVVQILAGALALLDEALDHQFVAASELIAAGRRQVVVTGMGKSGIIARKIAATFASTGTPAVFVHPSEAAHGDLGTLAPGDILLVLSNSGNTPELRPILNYSRRLAIPIIAAASSPDSMIMDMADVPILLPRVREACAANIAPTSSTAMQLALGDALAMAVMDMRGITREQLGLTHPGGAIGLQLSRVDEIMQTASALPLLGRRAPIGDVVCTISSGRHGLAGVLDEAGHLIGVISDGDLRRHFDDPGTTCAEEIMNPAPRSVTADMLGADALALLNRNAITAAFVVDTAQGGCKPIGIIHMHDLVRHGLG
ncbi:SIS domain-containing protein [Novosphingobium bradum]|uniref:SIS domain-containing protein n=1 Tax=Novosphingobium bradum TaxID=1737444 RepID=A0ABV7IKP6_9SPHN